MFDMQSRVEGGESAFRLLQGCLMYMLCFVSWLVSNRQVCSQDSPDVVLSRRVSEPDKTTTMSNQITKAAVSIEIHVIMERVDKPTIFTVSMCEASAATTSIILL